MQKHDPKADGPMSLQKNMTILIVEDDKAIVALIREFLAMNGHTVKVCNDGQSAIEIYKQGGIDMVISDYRMPKMNGVELLKALKKLDPDCCAMMITAHATNKAEIMEAGAKVVVIKPFRMKDFHEAVKLAAAYRTKI